MAVPATVQVLAPAKINLALHVVGLREDGYHLLDSLVSFANIGDLLTVTVPGQGQMSASGPFAADVPDDKSNLVFQVAERAWPGEAFSFHLHKELPVAAGIGGGSADAAACYRAIATMRQLGTRAPAERMMTKEKVEKLSSLGADIPMCVWSQSARVRGIGHEIEPVPSLPELNVVLVNPGVPVSTPLVFNALRKKENSGLTELSDNPDAKTLIDWLSRQRNDLQPPACDLNPEIHTVLSALENAPGASFARMSGSGATCFGVFEQKEDARATAKELKDQHPSWWIRAAVLNGPLRAEPYLIRSTT